MSAKNLSVSPKTLTVDGISHPTGSKICIKLEKEKLSLSLGGKMLCDFKYKKLNFVRAEASGAGMMLLQSDGLKFIFISNDATTHSINEAMGNSQSNLGLIQSTKSKSLLSDKSVSLRNEIKDDENVHPNRNNSQVQNAVARTSSTFKKIPQPSSGTANMRSTLNTSSGPVSQQLQKLAQHSSSSSQHVLGAKSVSVCRDAPRNSSISSRNDPYAQFAATSTRNQIQNQSQDRGQGTQPQMKTQPQPQTQGSQLYQSLCNSTKSPSRVSRTIQSSPSTPPSAKKRLMSPIMTRKESIESFERMSQSPPAKVRLSAQKSLFTDTERKARRSTLEPRNFLDDQPKIRNLPSNRRLSENDAHSTYLFDSNMNRFNDDDCKESYSNKSTSAHKATEGQRQGQGQIKATFVAVEQGMKAANTLRTFGNKGKYDRQTGFSSYQPGGLSSYNSISNSDSRKFGFPKNSMERDREGDRERERERVRERDRDTRILANAHRNSLFKSAFQSISVEDEDERDFEKVLADSVLTADAEKLRKEEREKEIERNERENIFLTDLNNDGDKSKDRTMTNFYKTGLGTSGCRGIILQPRGKFEGMRNLGNTCYLSSISQVRTYVCATTLIVTADSFILIISVYIYFY